ncbi:MAG TPA: UBP-type zinc finger domain-containing protein [Aggregicoccus sp.]|nr:UBP-type zinc finger domain-containing protein [Aggregicoccus sp.]
MATAQRCSHLANLPQPPARTRGCEECVQLGDHWVHLRRCLTCGHVGCCDSSKNKHASAHYRALQHPVIQSFEPGEDWRWCYADQVYVED